MSDLSQRLSRLSPEKRKLLELRLKREGLSLAGEQTIEAPQTITPHPGQRNLPFPLTDVQQAYWVGRSGIIELGNVSSHLYVEFDSVDLDVQRFNLALQRLIERHDMLRAVVLQEGKQKILEEVPPYQIEVLDLRGKDPRVVASELEAVRKRLSHQVLPADQWPLFEIRATRLDDRHVRLHASIDILIVDAFSTQILLGELHQAYLDPQVEFPPLQLSFRDYVLAEMEQRDSERYRQAQEYWWKRLPEMPPAPDLPLAKDPGLVTRPRFANRSARLEPESWDRLQKRAAQAGMTPSAVLMAAFAETLKVWSRNSRFTVNLTLFNRLPLHPQVNNVVGDFTSLVLLDVDNSELDTFEARARSLQRQLWDALDHRDVSAVQVMREMTRRKHGEPRTAIPVVFTSILGTESLAPDPTPISWLGDVEYLTTQTPQVWLDHIVLEHAGALVFGWFSVDELFPEGLLDDMFDAYCRLLRTLADEDESWQLSWPNMARRLVPVVQLARIADVNATKAEIPAVLLHSLFAEQVPQRPEQPAVIASQRTLTYRDLSQHATQVAKTLRDWGARPNTLVGIVMDKGWEQVVAALGVLEAGAAYLPLEAGLPKERLWHLLEHGQVEFVLTQPNWDPTIKWPDTVRRLVVDDRAHAPHDPPLADDAPLAPLQQPEDLAYVIYTSGSTGLPKGVMIDHRGAVNTIIDINQRFNVGPQDRVLALSSLGFDLSVYDVFGTLAAGGTIIMPDAAETRDPARWASLVRKEQVTIWNSVPALMGLLVEYVGERVELLSDALRLVLMSGDWIPVSLPGKIRALLPDAELISMGGATEASIWSIIYPIGEVDPAWPSIPYGKPMVNQTFHVLNQDLEYCPVWVPGELYIGGIGVALGYWRDEQRTNASFIQHPRTGERLYRTGDLGRYLPDGNIEFLGREDFQVKVQGMRIELGEIETALEQHPEVKTAVVNPVGDPRGEKRLVAYVVPARKPAPNSEELRTFLSGKLPEYMVPMVFVTMDRLPLTPNGKVDRTALPVPAEPDTVSRPTTVGQTRLREQIARLVEGVLHIDGIDYDANLLDLGATSVDMIRIANAFENEHGYRPDMLDLYRQPSVTGLVNSFEKRRPQPPVAADREEQPLEALPASVLGTFPLLLDPEEREAFRKAQPGLRQNDDQHPSIQLVLAESNEARIREYAERRSYRHFCRQPVALEQFSRLAGRLCQIKLGDRPKYLYGSAGSLYPVQTYWYIKPGRVQGVQAGIWYHHPAYHRLVMLSDGAGLDGSIYDFLINRPIYDQAAFAAFFVARLSAIAPMYGERSLHYASIEAGLMAQLLEMSAPASGIGLCQIGDLDFSRIRHLFNLDEDHVLVHSLLGGLIDPNHEEQWLPFQETDGNLFDRVDEWEEGEL